MLFLHATGIELGRPTSPSPSAVSPLPPSAATDKFVDTEHPQAKRRTPRRPPPRPLPPGQRNRAAARGAAVAVLDSPTAAAASPPLRRAIAVAPVHPQPRRCFARVRGEHAVLRDLSFPSPVLWSSRATARSCSRTSAACVDSSGEKPGFFRFLFRNKKTGTGHRCCNPVYTRIQTGNISGLNFLPVKNPEISGLATGFTYCCLNCFFSFHPFLPKCINMVLWLFKSSNGHFKKERYKNNNFHRCIQKCV